ncbi:hypothetical protein [Parafrankia sp. FMc2]|uniref:hypothetical protein n=1 Tax=Parafrankia sp. FMc2 TaxID=3233196 RepID=UPI0034D67893
MTALSRLEKSPPVDDGRTVVRPSRKKIRNLFLSMLAAGIPAAVFGRPWNRGPEGWGETLGMLAFVAVMLAGLGWWLRQQSRNERLVADEDGVTYTDWRGRATRIGRAEVSRASVVTARPARFSQQTDERLVVERSPSAPPLWFRTHVWNREDIQRLFDRIDVPFQTVDGVHHARALPAMFPRLRLPFSERRPVLFGVLLSSGLCLAVGLFLLVAVVLL